MPFISALPEVTPQVGLRKGGGSPLGWAIQRTPGGDCQWDGSATSQAFTDRLAADEVYLWRQARVREPLKHPMDLLAFQKIFSCNRCAEFAGKFLHVQSRKISSLCFNVDTKQLRG